MDILDLNHTCSQVSYPFCRLITDAFNMYDAKPADLRGSKIENPATLALLLVEIFCTVRMILSTKFKYSNVGRKEIIFFFYLLLCSLIMQFFLVTKIFYSFHVIIQRLFVSAFISFVNTAMVSLVAGSFLSSSLTYSSNYSIPILRTVCTIVFVSLFIFFSIFLRKTFGFLLFVGFFSFNFLCSMSFFLILFLKLKKMKSDIWCIGSFYIAVFLYFLSVLFNFIGNFIIFKISNSYLDSLFFVNLSLFCSVLMVHKIWDSTNDTEEECYIVSMPKWYNNISISDEKKNK